MNDHPDQPPVSQPGPSSKRRRIPKWALISGILLFVIISAGFGRHFYLGWKERRLIRHARFFLDTGKMREMTITLDSALALNPNNPEAIRISAQAKQKMGDKNALSWFRRAVELSPENIDDKIALAEATLRFNQALEADKLIHDMEPKAKGRADFHDLAGRIAQNLERMDAAAEHFAEAVKLAPDNKTYRLRLAIVYLNSQDLAVRQKARADIDQLSSETSLQAEAWRALIIDAVRLTQIGRAVTLAEKLNAVPNRLFSDRLMYLEVLHLAKSPDFYSRLEETQRDAAKSTDFIYQTLFWMNGKNLSVLAKDWAQKLPEDIASAPPIRLEIARAYAAYGDWKTLRFFLAKEKWFDLEYMRLAMLAKCYRELDASPANSKASWAEAINATNNYGDFLLALARLAEEWRWDGEAEDALWQAVNKSNRSTEALNRLSQLYYFRRDTQGLYRVHTLLIDRNPTDLNARNNFVIFTLLLNKDKNLAESIAKDLYAKKSDSPMFASTYAFALSCNGKNNQALDIMKKLTAEKLQEPSIAAYYSFMLEKAGRAAEAEEYKKMGREARLLPEEERMLNLTPTRTSSPVNTDSAPQPTPAVNP